MSCSCDAPFANIGANPCKDLRKVARRFILVPEFDSAGDKNSIATIAGVTKSALQAKFDASAIADRWFPTPQFENVENVRADAVRQEFNSGKSVKVRDGVRTMTVFFPLQGNLWMGKLEKFECLSMGFYEIDADGNFIYSKCPTDGTVDPILIEDGTMDIEYIPATDSEVSMVKMMFDIRLSEKDAEQRYIESSELDFDALSNSDVYSLYDVESVNSGISTTALTVTLTTDFGVKVGGLLEADFALYNVTDASAVTIASFTESAKGVYDFTFIAQDVADVIRVTPTKAKFDFSAVVTNTATIV